MVLVQSSVDTIWASLFEMKLEPNLLDWNVNELERKLELEDMKRTTYGFIPIKTVLKSQLNLAAKKHPKKPLNLICKLKVKVLKYVLHYVYINSF